MARCLALLGMVATHVLDSHQADGDLALAQAVAGGRASALFAVLAGVTLALMTGGREPVRGRERLADLLRSALAPPPPPRRPTRPTRGSQRRRLEAKKQRGETKSLRGRVTGE